jgi:MFS family permease
MLALVLLSPFSGVPDAKRLFAWSIVSRMPLAAIGVVLVVHAREVTGSYAVAGVVAAANAVATAIGAPLLGRAVDRRGSQTAVLLASAALCGACPTTPPSCRSSRSPASLGWPSRR